MNRRHFVISSASLAAMAGCASPAGTALAPSRLGAAARAGAPQAAGLRTRLEIEEFSANAKLVAAFRRGVAKMRAETFAPSVASWQYWHNSHWMKDGTPPPEMRNVWDQCRHGQSFFLAWHRGYLHFFEEQLRLAAGDPELSLPYWDYYKNPNLPAIFTDPTLPDGSANPLYWADRRNSLVTGLSYASFANSVVTFPYGPGTTFEDLVESNPHNRVHNQVGGSMGEVPTAPADPIFYLHHCNIDRYWSCWLAAGGGRHMPPRGDLWWKQGFAYNLARTWYFDVRAMNDSRNLGYTYGDLRFPVMPMGATLPARPRIAATGSTDTAGPYDLALEPITIAVPLSDALGRAARVRVVLEGVALTAAGRRGGFDVGVYADLPERPAPLAEESRFAIGEFGTFEITMPKMGAMPNATPAGASLRMRATRAATAELLISFVPFGAPSGVGRTTPLARIERLRVEIA